MNPVLAPIVDEAMRFPLVFAHVGLLFAPDVLVAELLEALSHGPVMDVAASNPTSGGILVGFEKIVGRADRCERLSQVRSSVMKHLDNGQRFVAVSRVPKIALLGCEGSQLILDARTVFADRVDEEKVIARLQAAAELHAKEQAQRVSQTLGLPALVDQISSTVFRTRLDRGERNRAVDAQLERLLTQACAELGPLAGSILDDSMRFGERLLPEDGQDPLITEALRGSGFAKLNRSERLLEVFDESLLASARRAVSASNDNYVDCDSSSTTVFKGLWEIERRLRRRVQELAVGKHGSNWQDRVALTDAHRDRILERASSDLGITVGSLPETGNPLQWMTLDEVLELIGEQHEWACPPETPPSFFRRLRAEIQPIRNRAAHCRLPQFRDDDTVARWRLEVGRRLRPPAVAECELND